MKQQTAVQFLFENIQQVHKMNWDILFLHVIELERSQIEKAFIAGDCGYHPDNGTQERMAKDYYNENFNNGTI